MPFAEWIKTTDLCRDASYSVMEIVWNAAVLAEQERCAKVAEKEFEGAPGTAYAAGRAIARHIRGGQS